MFAYITIDLPKLMQKEVHKKNKQFVTPRSKMEVPTSSAIILLWRNWQTQSAQTRLFMSSSLIRSIMARSTSGSSRWPFTPESRVRVPYALFVGRQALKANKKIKLNYVGTPRRDTSQSRGRSVRYFGTIVATQLRCV